MKWKSNTIHIAISLDENYINPLYVLLTSVFLNNKETAIVIHSIITGIDNTQKNEIAEYIHQNNGEIYFYKIDQENLSGLVIPENMSLTVATYYRLFFPVLVPMEIEKLLYIDADAVVIKNLRELYNINIGSKPVGAVSDKIRKPRPELGHYSTENYFNAGVMLINISEWKKQEVTERALQFVYDFPERIISPDQDALNAVLIDNWHRLDARYNVRHLDIPPYLGKKDINAFLKEKVIIHFTGGIHKPWCALGKNRLRYLYHYYLKQSPRHFEKKYDDVRLTGYFVYEFARIRFVEAVRNYPKLLTLSLAVRRAIRVLTESGKK